ncbi:HAD family phosphatase [Patescibacteria group bacterium]|nr:HAD family phosphatase [Patescibacteria group bacterium]
MPDNKAFIFDLDGVIIDSETWWDRLHFKKEGHSLGQTISSAFAEAKLTNPGLSWEKYLAKLNRVAKTIYHQAPLAPGINELLKFLIKHDYRLGLVSGSTQKWIDYVRQRLLWPIANTISLEDRQDLKPKPSPDGYLTMIKTLKVKPENTLILEDTDMGIKSAKAAGALTICLTRFHPQNYRPEGADLYVKSLKELLIYLNPIKL